MLNNLYNQKKWVDRFIYDHPANPDDEERVRRILEILPKNIRTILDVGTGGGYIYNALKHMKLECAGFDISFQLVKKIKDAHICVGDIKNIPYKDNGFDLVLAADIIEHVKEECFDESISELVRVAGEYIVINSPYKDAINWPVSLCVNCGREFNVYGHMRSVNIALMKRIFPGDKFDILKVDIFGNKRDLRPAFLVNLARRLGKVYSSESSVCPYCFSETSGQPSRNAFEVLCGKVICSIFFLMDKAMPSMFKRGNEICVLLRKKK